MGTPEINLSQEWLEWPSGTRREAVSPYELMEKVVYDPVVSDAPIPIGILTKPAEVTEVLAYLNGSSTPVVIFGLKWGSDIAGTGTDLVAYGSGTTSTTPQSFTIQRGNIPTQNVIWLEVLYRSGMVHTFTISIKFRTRV